MSVDTNSHESGDKKWQPLSAHQCRVAGVLVEKAKTTPDSYPLTLNALTNGCNQKSNRAPQMQLSPDEIEQALEELREMGAVGEIQGGGRASKYRHYMYDWLGISKVELAVVAELFLRGAQTVGELRSRAARMEPIPDLHVLRPVLDSLHEKQLVVFLTPPGRGQVVTHNLLSPEKLERLKQQFAAGHRAPAERASTGGSSSQSSDALVALQTEVAQLRTEMEQFRQELDALKQDHEVAEPPSHAPT